MPFVIPRLPAELPTSQPRWIGQAMKRVEDPILLTGQAEFTDNLHFPGMLHAAFVRSPHAHARIVRIDTSRAEALPGVVVLATGHDAEQNTGKLAGIPPGFQSHCLAVDKARFAGEIVAAVAALSRYIAEDAVELIDVEYEVLSPALDACTAMAPESPRVFEEQQSNVIYRRHFSFGDVDAAFNAADVVVRHRYRFPRVSANPLETNSCIVRWNPLTNEVTAWGSFQSPAISATGVAAMLRLPTNRVRLVGQPHGGSFGSKHLPARAIGPVALLSRRAGGRPVKWIEDRLEHLQAAGSDAWERWYEGELALSRDGKARALRVTCIDDQGSSAEFPIQPLKPLVMFTGCYEIPACAYDLTIVATNKNPQGALRGAGPPPHTLLLEWLMDKAARALNLDPADIRRRNFIPPERFPYTLPSGNEYDSGNYSACLDALLELSEYPRRRREQTEARRRGRLVGLGLVTAIEIGVPAGGLMSLINPAIGRTSCPEGAIVRVDGFGRIVVELGFPLEGQGQPTIVTQVLADYFSVPPADITVRTVDSQAAPPGLGPGGSKQAVALTGAVLGAAERIKEKLIRVAAVLLEAGVGDVEFKDGTFALRGIPERALPLAQVAWTLINRTDLLPFELDGSAEASFVYNWPGRTLPDEQGRVKGYRTAANAAHLVEVEVDPETGVVSILGYWLVDDCGTRLNPAIVDGMTQGGLAHGVGVAFLEEYVYGEGGQRLNTTFMDYLLPTSSDVPFSHKRALTTPSPYTPLGAKGSGEGAIHTTPAALYCAVNDALAPLGVQIAELPMSPSRIWHALRAARNGVPDEERR